MNYLDVVNYVYDHLDDDESRRIFDISLRFSAQRNEREYVLSLLALHDDWKMISDIDEPSNESPLIICGAGHDGMISSSILQYLGYKVLCFTDKKKRGTLDGLDIFSIDEAKQKYPEARFVIASRTYKNSIKEELCGAGIEDRRIINPPHNYLSLERGTTYFDQFEPIEDEVFIDAGAFKGDTIEGFRKWTNNQYKKIISLEPVEEYFKEVLGRYTNEERIEIYNNAAWDKEERLGIVLDGPGSRVTGVNQIEIDGLDIDTIVGDDTKVTFIKMDIEGSELKALSGAKKTISRYHPRMAICAYHKPGDYIDLASYILSINEEYRLYLRKYYTNTLETVLYAV